MSKARLVSCDGFGIKTVGFLHPCNLVAVHNLSGAQQEEIDLSYAAFAALGRFTLL
jgi:hypothetical protein